MNTNETIECVMPLIVGNEVQNTANPDILTKGITGQEEACKKLAFYVRSNTPETPFPTLLFTGSQGLGKSFLANKTALALNRKFIEVNCGSSSIQKADNFIEEVLIGRVLGETPVTLFLDEAHKLSSEVTTLLLTLLNPNSSYKNKITNGHYTLEYDFSKINVILATTDAYTLFKPLRNRCEQIYFHCYSDEELFDIVKFYLKDIKVDRTNWVEIARACRGRARDAFLLAENIKRLCNVNKVNRLTTKEWLELKNIFGINSQGLNDQEVDLLRILADNSPMSCHNIAVRMGVNEKNIEEDIEIRLKEVGYVRNTTKGRILTVEGNKYLEKTKQVA